MVTDGQVRRVAPRARLGNFRWPSAARRTGMTDKTARHYRDQPHAAQRPQEGRCRGPTARGSIRSRRSGPRSRSGLRAEPRLLAKTLFDWLRRAASGPVPRFASPHLRAACAAVASHATDRPSRSCSARCIEAGDLAASDFTHMNALGITITGQPFDHLVYHFVLTYSNWEIGHASASSESRSRASVRRLAKCVVGTGRRAPAAPHRSPDRGGEQPVGDTASSRRAIATCWRHYGLPGQPINARQAARERRRRADATTGLQDRRRPGVDAARQPRFRQPRGLRAVPAADW